MNLKTKIILVFLLSLLGVALVLGRTGYSQFVVRQQQEAEEHLSNVAETLARQMDQRLSGWQQQMVIAAQGRESGAGKGLKVESDILWLVKLKKNTQGSWQAEWVEQKVENATESVADMARQIYAILPLKKIFTGQRVVVPFAWGKTSESMLAMIVPMTVRYLEESGSEEVLYVGVFASEALKASSKTLHTSGDQKVIDDEGNILAATDSNLEGTRLEDSDLLATVLDSLKERSSFQRNANGSDLENVAFVKAHATNLYALVAETSNAKNAFLIWLTVAGLTLLVIGGVAAWLVVSYTGQTVNGFKKIGEGLADLAQGRLQTPIADHGPAQVLKMLTHLKMLQSKLLSSVQTPQSDKRPSPVVTEKIIDRSQEFREQMVARVDPPLSAILGSAQKGRQSAKNPEVLGHFNMIVREIEDLRKYMDELGGSAILDKDQFEEVSLMDVVNRAVSQLSGDFKRGGVVLRKDYHTVPSLRGQANRLQAAIAEVLRNSLDAARASDKKEVLVGLAPAGKAVKLSVTDWGWHDPFSETDGERITSVDLLSVLSTFGAHQGDIQLDYSEENCRTIRLFLPLAGVDFELSESVVLAAEGGPRHQRTSKESPKLPADLTEFEDLDGNQ